ncbi:hypothetical protein FNF29_04495 [Cafeteria roenbergensis]|uniref:ABC transporter domain-containing protein n=1 Tax=Cafeteria roenbergensis TaxID=33653 RepID=A0A5A8CIC0_CAFRO|nr:hypothetical protein FNF29_04495 [Cafeteria roenbergensis]|eukprot:KAA0151571.1 hypothetical protein FNF29_04495 [Cafeteria roenbergensis]
MLRHALRSASFRNPTETRFSPFDAFRFLQVIGNPGSGKSTLLRLGSLLPVSGAHVTGGATRLSVVGADAEFNAEVAHWPRLASMATQFDNHFGLLTVGETLAFAAANQQPAVPGGPTGLSAEEVAKHIGLDNVMNTRLGTETVRGVSGGEARRVSVGEAMVGPARVWMLDSFSDGLDAARTKAITSGLLRPFAEELGGTVVAALQQPAQELFELFDDVILLRDGRCLYCGPVADAPAFFEGKLGLKREDDVSDPEFLAAVCSEPESFGRPGRRVASAPLSDVPLTAPSLAAAYVAHVVREDDSAADAPLLSSNSSTGPLDKEQARAIFAASYARNGFAQTASVSYREVVNTVRDIQFLQSHFVRAIILALIVGSLFSGLGVDDFVQRISLIFFACLQLAMGGAAELPVALNNKIIVDRQSRVNHMYRPFLYALSVSLVYLPIVALETILFCAPMYYMVGFAEAGERFAVFFSIILLLVIAMTSTFRFVAWVSGSLEVALAGMVPFIALFILFSGFLATRSNLGWGDLGQGIYWFTPISWAIRALAINEFNAPEYDAVIPVPRAPPGTMMRKGTVYLQTYDVEPEDEWIAYGYIYIGAFCVLIIILGSITFACRVISEPRGTQRRLAGKTAADKLAASAAGRAVSAAPAAGDVEASTAAGASDAKDAPVAGAATPAGATGKVSHGKKLAFRDLVFDVRLVGAAAKKAAAKQAKSDKKAEADPSVLDAGAVARGHKRLLHRISGVARPGRILALCGESGAGKTTLLNTLAGRTVTQGHVMGSIILGGTAIAATQLRPRVGYCEQFDRHLATATVREALEFSAWMRRGHAATHANVMAAVDEALDLLELRPVEHRAIGDEKAGWGLSRGERKRVTIGVELVADPSVLFLDEPTTALSSTQARDVARVIRRVADSGRTVVCTLHQPSAGVWSAMDDLLLLARGGYTVYYGPLGPGSRTMVDYLESLPGSHPLPDGMNPADYMLDVIGSEGKTDAKVAGVRAAAAPAGGEPALASRASTDAAGAHAEGKPAAAAAAAPTRAQLLRGKFIESAAKATLDETLDGMGIERDSHSRRLAKTSVAADAHGDASRPNFCVQFAMLTKRASVDFFRDTEFGLKRCVLFVMLALIAGGVFFQIEDNTQSGVMSLVGGVVMGVIFVSAITANTTAVAIGKRRPSFTREQAAHTFDPTAYGLALTVANLPWIFIFSVLFTVVYALMVGYAFSVVPFMILVVFILANSFSMIALVLGFLAETPQLMTSILSVIMAVASMFSGFFLPRADIPDGWIWVHYLSPQSYALEAAIPSVFVCPEGEPVVSYARGPCGTIDALDGGVLKKDVPKLDFIEGLYGLEAQYSGRAIGIMVAESAALLLLLIYALWRLRSKAA